eukprot:gene24239-biopygen2895
MRSQRAGSIACTDHRERRRMAPDPTPCQARRGRWSDRNGIARHAPAAAVRLEEAAVDEARTQPFLSDPERDCNRFSLGPRATQCTQGAGNLRAGCQR